MANNQTQKHYANLSRASNNHNQLREAHKKDRRLAKTQFPTKMKSNEETIDGTGTNCV